MKTTTTTALEAQSKVPAVELVTAAPSQPVPLALAEEGTQETPQNSDDESPDEDKTEEESESSEEEEKEE